MSESSDIAKKYTILRCVVGSKLYGTSIEGSDTDEMGVCIEPLEKVAGFHDFEQDIQQTKNPTTGHMSAETKIYSLRKFLRLALQGNPDVTPLLFVPFKFQTVSHALGRQLQDLAPYIVSRLCGARYLGYMESQRQRMIGERGQKRTNRPELIEKYGFDTKYAMQVLRLGMQGFELMATGKLVMPLDEVSTKFLIRVRNGEYDINEVLDRAGKLERNLKDAIDLSPLPETPSVDVVEEWMIRTYWESWKAARFMIDQPISKATH